jgi:hypothetical protein
VIFAYYRNSSGSWVYWAQSPSLPSSSTWTNGTWTTPALPSGASAISFGLGLRGKGSLTVDDFALADTAAPDPSPAPSPTPTPTPPPTSSTLFNETFDAPNGANSVWGTPGWASNPVAAPGWHSEGGTILSVADDKPTNVGSTGNDTDMQRWWVHQAYSGNTRVEADLKPIGWDGNAQSRSTWAGFEFYMRRQVDSNESSFYTVEPYIYNGQVHIQKKCYGVIDTTNPLSVDTGAGGTYYLIANKSNVPITMSQWHHVAAEAVDNPDGSVTLTLYRDGVKMLQATDTVGLTGCAPLIGGRMGWRTDSAKYELDNFNISQLP